MTRLQRCRLEARITHVIGIDAPAFCITAGSCEQRSAGVQIGSLSSPQESRLLLDDAMYVSSRQ